MSAGAAGGDRAESAGGAGVMTDIERRVRDYLMTLRQLDDDEFERVVVCPKSDAVVAEALGVPVEDVTTALYALSEREDIDVWGHANYGPIVAIYKQPTEVPA